MQSLQCEDSLTQRRSGRPAS